jgi:hypothetical protein
MPVNTYPVTSLTALLTSAGVAYVDLTAVEAISAPFAQAGRETRQITTNAGAKIFILNTPENYAKLAFLLPDDAKALAKTVPPPPQKPVPTEAPTAKDTDADDAPKAPTRQRRFRKGN